MVTLVILLMGDLSECKSLDLLLKWTTSPSFVDACSAQGGAKRGRSTFLVFSFFIFFVLSQVSSVSCVEANNIVCGWCVNV